MSFHFFNISYHTPIICNYFITNTDGEGCLVTFDISCHMMYETDGIPGKTVHLRSHEKFHFQEVE